MKYNNETPPTVNVVMQVNSNSHYILLQTAKAESFNSDQNMKAFNRLLFDPRSQRTYCTNNLRKILKFKTAKKEIFLMKRFASDLRERKN